MRLLTSYQPLAYDRQKLLESRDSNGGKIILSGILQKANALNQNGRVYPRDILEREIMNYQKLISENRALGETDHPQESVIELKNVSHIVRSAYMDGDDVLGTVELLNTPSGKILQSLIESNITLGISSRGVGSTKTVGDREIVQDDFTLICFDMVSEPSTSGAFMMREGREVSRDELNRILSWSDRVDRLLNDVIAWRCDGRSSEEKSADCAARGVKCR